MKQTTIFTAILMASCATHSNTVEITEMTPGELPASVFVAMAAERPDFVATEVQKKVRDGRVYYDVEGELADGSELEFDVLMDGEDATIVEIQRDLDWSDVPEEVQAIALDASGSAVPVRTIESVQTDGAVIYELFAQGQPSDPAWEVRVHAGVVELLDERWVH